MHRMLHLPLRTMVTVAVKVYLVLPSATCSKSDHRYSGLTQGMPRELRGDGSDRLPFVLVNADRNIIGSVVIFLKAVSDPFVRHQVNTMIRATLQVLFRVPAAAHYLEANFSDLPAVFEGLVDLSEQIREENTEFRRNAYLKTVLNVVED